VLAAGAWLTGCGGAGESPQGVDAGGVAASLPSEEAAPAQLAPDTVTPVRAHGLLLEAPKGWAVSDQTEGPFGVLAVEGPATDTPPGPAVDLVVCDDPAVTADSLVKMLANGASQRWVQADGKQSAVISVPFLGQPRSGFRLTWSQDGVPREEVLVGAQLGTRAVVAIEETPLTVSQKVAPILRAVRASVTLVGDGASGATTSAPASTTAASQP
jgi:hypothetical protein